jgi:hypothetical protein
MNAILDPVNDLARPFVYSLHYYAAYYAIIRRTPGAFITPAFYNPFTLHISVLNDDTTAHQPNPTRYSTLRNPDDQYLLYLDIICKRLTRVTCFHI